MSNIFQEKHKKNWREHQFNLLFNLQSKYYHESWFFFHKFCFFLDTFFNNVDLLHYRNCSNFSLCLLTHVTFNMFLGRFLILAFYFLSSLVICSNLIFSQIYISASISLFISLKKIYKSLEVWKSFFLLYNLVTNSLLDVKQE